MIPLTIAPRTESGKGRSFHSTLLAYATAPGLWAGGESGNAVRPVWAVVSSTDQELRPFLANFTRGGKAFDGNGTRSSTTYELLKTAGYAPPAIQRFPEGSTATIYLPDLFRVDPGMVDPERVRFVMLPGTEWAKAQRIPDAQRIADYARRLHKKRAEEDWFKAMDELVPFAFLFAVYLDRRTRCPLVADGRFYLQLMLACLRDGLAGWSMSSGYRRSGGEFCCGPKFETMGLTGVGYSERGALAFNASQVDVETLLAAEVDLFFERVGSEGFVSIMKGGVA